MLSFIPFLFNTFFYRPLYNILIVLSGLVPHGDLGIAIILLTLVVRLIFAPLSHKALHTQKKLKEIEPEMAALKEKHKDNAEAQGKAMMELYKAHGVNPFSGILLLFIQLPLFIALYWVAKDNLASVPTVMYSFVHAPAVISRLFLGIIDITQPNILLAILAGASYFFQAQLAIPPAPKKKKDGKETSFSDEFMQGMNLQMRYILPLLIMFLGFKLGAAVLLYWITTNGFSISHELLIRRKAKALVTTE